MTSHLRSGTFVVLSVLGVLATGTPAGAQTATALETREHIETLAGEPLQGRLAGSPGEVQAADYIVEQLKEIGAQPLPGQRDYRLAFDFTAGTRDGGSSVAVGGSAFRGPEVVQALSFSDNGSVTG